MIAKIPLTQIYLEINFGGALFIKTHNLNKRNLSILVIAIIILALLGLYFSDITFRQIWELMTESVIISTLLLLAFFGLKLIFWVIPLRVLYFSAGFLLPWWLAIIVIYTGLIFHLSVTYRWGKTRGLQQVVKEIEKRKSGRWILESIKDNVKFSCFIVRTIPGPPVEVTNMFFGALELPFFEYLGLSLAGMSTIVLPTMLMGQFVTDPSSAEFVSPLILTVGIPLVSLFVYWRFTKRRDKES